MAANTPIILGNLTAAWTAPQACSTAIGACSTCDYAWRAQRCPGGTTVQDDVACWPPRTRNVQTPSPLMAWGVYTPGLECPGGYTTACTHDGAKARGDFSFVWPPQVSETAVGCCPSGFECSRNGDSQTCVSRQTAGTFTSVTCEAGATASASTKAVPFAAPDISSTATISTMSFVAPLIQMVMQATDLTPVSSQTGMSTISPSSASSSSAPLSQGAVAGIAVGATLVAVALIGGLVFMLCRSRRKRRREGAAAQAQMQMQIPTTPHPQGYEMSLSQGGSPESRQFASPGLSTTPSKVMKPEELPAPVPAVELDSGRY